MKKIKIYIILSALIGMIGCSDELNVKPHTFVSDVSFYETEAQIKAAVNGIYAKLQDMYRGGDRIYMVTEFRADNTDFQYSETDRGGQQRDDINDFLMTASNVYSQMIWQFLYDGIQQANLVIGNIGAVNFSDPKLKAQYEGEVKFLRAFLYFHLVRLYGSVPLRQIATTGPEDAFSSEKATVDQLYTFIKEDVKFAIENLPPKYTGKEIGRATMGAALTLQGEIHLTLHDYSSAITSFEAVTKLGYDLVRGNNAYAAVFDPTKKNNIESIFEIQYNASLDGENSDYIFAWGPRNARQALTGFTSGDLPGNQIPTLDIIQAYEAGDLRRDASIAFDVNSKNRNFQESFGTNLSIVGDSLPYIKKFYHPPYTVDGRANENWPIYRYAYLKLMLADALNEAGRGSEALPLINDIRDRAGLSALTYVGQQQLRDAIFQETRIEVAFENHRWYQLLRTGKAIEVMTAHGSAQKARLKEAADKLQQVRHITDASYNILPYKLLFPIPERECRLNGFENNPEWR